VPTKRCGRTTRSSPSTAPATGREYAYSRGAASLLDFLDAQRSYSATELAYRQALASYMLAIEQLKEAAGVSSLP
jgi:cobalt-zinc-cadmium efflux system outer membrane protein